jgi:8-oxo-dGTP diphosphatase
MNSLQKVYVVGAVIMNDAEEILCAKRSKTMSLAGLWEFPGGKIEPGESPREALVREIQEELGCTVEIGAFVTSCTHEYPHVIVTLDTYFARIMDGTPTPSEHEQLKWLRVDQLNTLDWAPADIPTVLKLEQMQKTADGGLLL